MTYRGDFNVGATIRFMWNTFAVAGESITRATNGTISVYKDGGTTQSTVGVTDTEDFDSLAGVHYVAIDTSADGTFYSAGSDFAVVLSGATVDGKSINAVLAEFSIRNRSALMPTTAGRTLDVSAGGEAGLDWANIGSPSSSVNLSGTNIDVDQVVASVSAGVTVSDKTGFSLSAAGISAIWSSATRTLTSFGTLASQIWNYTPRSLDTWELLVEGIWTNAARTLTSTADSAGVTTLLSRIGAALSFTSGRVNAQVAGMDADTLTAAAVAADAVTEIQNGVATASAVAAITTIADRLNTMLELAGVDYRFTVAALANAGGGGATVEDIFEAQPGLYDDDAAGFAALFLAMKAKADLIGTGMVREQTSGVSADGRTIRVVRGGDCKAADGLSLDFLFDDIGYDFTGATDITMTFITAAGDPIPGLEVEGSALAAKQLRFEPTRAQTLLLPEVVGSDPSREIRFQIVATLANTSTVFPVPERFGRCIVLRGN